MLLTQRILYLVSFDEIEPAVTAQVAEISKALSAPVFLVAGLGTGSGLWRNRHDEEVQARAGLESVADNLRARRASLGHTLVLKGNRAVVAMEAAERMEADFIVVGAGESSRQDPTFVRTTAKILARTAREHVWICKPEADAALQHVLCAFNESRGSADGIRVSVDLCRQFNAKLQLLSVLQEPDAGLVGGSEQERDEAIEASRRQLHDRRLAALDGFNVSGVALARNIVWDTAASQAVLAEAGRHPEGLLTLGVSGRRRFPAMMLGNTAEKILRHCPSSLLLVK
ncbi:MAG: hypothetical protein CMN28_04545 [Salinisphaeraceae bacterium]|nr:hypothetical protein [Salinisphaeraceae bacterium]